VLSQVSYDEIDELLVQIRLSILKLRQSDPATADKLKSLISQLELWVECLVIDAHRFRRLESMLQCTAKMAKKLLEDLGDNSSVCGM
jgi:hypothetical protein